MLYWCFQGQEWIFSPKLRSYNYILTQGHKRNGQINKPIKPQQGVTRTVSILLKQVVRTLTMVEFLFNKWWKWPFIIWKRQKRWKQMWLDLTQVLLTIVMWYLIVFSCLLLCHNTQKGWLRWCIYQCLNRTSTPVQNCPCSQITLSPQSYPKKHQTDTWNMFKATKNTSEWQYSAVWVWCLLQCCLILSTRWCSISIRA